MTPAQFRRAVLRFLEEVEGAHHGHVDFRGTPPTTDLVIWIWTGGPRARRGA
jgi:hypothetical protein